MSGSEGIRTLDLLNAIETRSQLRHGPKSSHTSIRSFRCNVRITALATLHLHCCKFSFGKATYG